MYGYTCAFRRAVFAVICFLARFGIYRRLNENSHSLPSVFFTQVCCSPSSAILDLWGTSQTCTILHTSTNKLKHRVSSPRHPYVRLFEVREAFKRNYFVYLVFGRVFVHISHFFATTDKFPGGQHRASETDLFSEKMVFLIFLRS